MNFLESYCDARTHALGAQEMMIDPAPVQAPADDNTDSIGPDSRSEVKVPTATAFEQMVNEVQHDLACLDIDREERELIDHFISTTKVFASFYFKHSAEDPQEAV